MGNWRKAPSGVNCVKKLELLKEEGVTFDSKGILIDRRKLFLKFSV
jgi:methylated-DNA-[protein]-cysteine S-methyltransferase